MCTASRDLTVVSGLQLPLSGDACSLLSPHTGNFLEIPSGDEGYSDLKPRGCGGDPDLLNTCRNIL